MEPESLQNVLHEAGIQVDMKNLQNPTEEFMIYLITEYLSKFYFDGIEISKSTPEQLECVSCPDSTSDAIKVINLHSAIASVCNEIFLKDLSLTDITSPGPKRARRQIKILFNFFAYFKNKMVENEMAFLELDNQQKMIEELIDKKNAVIAKIGATINERENKLELKQQLQQEINEICIDIEENVKKTKELEHRMKGVRMKHQEVCKITSDLKARARKLHKDTTELQSKIVKSPEEYAARSKELKKVLEVKKEERQVLNDSITRKKLQIKNNENAQELVNSLNEKFSENSSETFKQLKEVSEKLDIVQKELNLLKMDIAKWMNVDMNNSNTCSKDTDLKSYEQLLYELDNQYMAKEREFQSQKDILEKFSSDLNKKKYLLEDELKAIIAIEEDNSNTFQQYKEHFEKEISEELSLRETVSKSIFKTDDDRHL